MRTRVNIVQCWAVRAVGPTYEFLQLLRRADDYMGNTWHPVSGGIEAGETAWQAALRELREEAGLEALELYSINTVQTFYVAGDDALWTSVPFCALVSTQAVVRLNDENPAYRWVEQSKIDSHLIWPGDRHVAEEIRREILGHGPSRAFLKINIGSTDASFKMP